MNQINKDASSQANRRLMKPWLFAVIGLIAVVAIVSAVKMIDKGSNQTSPESLGSSQATSTTGTLVTTGDSEFGKMLFNEENQAIYIWELEESNKAECYSNCAEAWPPVLTDGTPRAGVGVNTALLGTTKRTDGSTQVTYNGHPLYYYAHEGAGEVKCHNIRTHGGYWWVIDPNGDRVK